MKPIGHLIVGGSMSGLALIFFNFKLTIGVFLGSILLDIDHIFFFWQIDTKSLFSLKRIFQLTNELYRQSAKNQWLEIAFLHTVEVFLAIFYLTIRLNLEWLWAFTIAACLHIFLDYLDMILRKDHLSLRCWSIIQYFIRKKRGEKTYFELWPKK